MVELRDDVSTRDVDQLIPYANNPKKHPDEQVDKIASSIKNYGFVQPLVVDEDGEVVIGHGRLQAAKKLGMEKVPVICIDDLSEAELQALRLADNKVAESGWDDELLGGELQQLNDEFTGFDDTEFAEIQDDQTEVDEVEADNPDQVETDIKEGEVYRLGDHRLMCGDATNEDHVELLMNGSKADMVFTDPPYGIEFQSNHREQSSKSENFDKLKNDDKILNIKPVLDENTSKKCHWYIFTGHQVYPVWRKQFEEYYKSTIIWKKPGGSMGDLEGDYKPMYEMCIYCQLGNKKLNGMREENIWEISRDNEYQHPTQKPVELPAKAIKNSSNRDNIVLDLFAGSGSTLLAAQQTNRKSFCMELDPQYCQVIINRWKVLTGMEAEQVVGVE